jgi:hypothetical protein
MTTPSKVTLPHLFINRSHPYMHTKEVLEVKIANILKPKIENFQRPGTGMRWGVWGEIGG